MSTTTIKPIQMSPPPPSQTEVVSSLETLNSTDTSLSSRLQTLENLNISSRLTTIENLNIALNLNMLKTNQVRFVQLSSSANTAQHKFKFTTPNNMGVLFARRGSYYSVWLLDTWSSPLQILGAETGDYLTVTKVDSNNNVTTYGNTYIVDNPTTERGAIVITLLMSYTPPDLTYIPDES